VTPRGYLAHKRHIPPWAPKHSPHQKVLPRGRAVRAGVKAERGGAGGGTRRDTPWYPREREFFIDNLLVRIHLIIEMT
jgi:hypothetical protein